MDGTHPPTRLLIPKETRGTSWRHEDEWWWIAGGAAEPRPYPPAPIRPCQSDGNEQTILQFCPSSGKGSTNAPVLYRLVPRLAAECTGEFCSTAGLDGAITRLGKLNGPSHPRTDGRSARRLLGYPCIASTAANIPSSHTAGGPDVVVSMAPG